MNSALLTCSKCRNAEHSENFATIWDLEMHIAKQHFDGRALYECRMNGCEIWFYTQTHLWRHFQRNHSGSELAKSTKSKLKAQEILNKSIINRVSSAILESGNEIFTYQCFECNKSGPNSEMFATFEALEAHIVKKHCDSSVYYECDDKTCGGILHSYGTFLGHCVNEHGKLEENITLKLQIYVSVKESIEKRILDLYNAHLNPGRDETATNRNHPKADETKRKRPHSPGSFEQDTPRKKVLRRLSDVLSNDDSGYSDTFDIDRPSSLLFNVWKSESTQNVLLRISDVLNNDDFNCTDTYITSELNNGMNGALTTTADFDQTVEESIDVVSLLPCENSVVDPDTIMESQNNTTGLFDGTEFDYITTCSDDDNSMDVSSIVHYLDFDDETVAPNISLSQFVSLLEEPSENLGLSQNTPEYHCDQCNKSFASKSNLSRHISILHMRNNKLHQCNLCEFSTNHKHDLKVHMYVHSKTKTKKSYRCEFCPYVAKKPVALKVHVRRHTGEKPYKCRECPYASAYNSELKLHIRKHTGENPYKCDQCSYATVRFSGLKKHMFQHTTSHEKP